MSQITPPQTKIRYGLYPSVNCLVEVGALGISKLSTYAKRRCPSELSQKASSAFEWCKPYFQNVVTKSIIGVVKSIAFDCSKVVGDLNPRNHHKSLAPCYFLYHKIIKNAQKLHTSIGTSIPRQELFQQEVTTLLNEHFSDQTDPNKALFLELIKPHLGEYTLKTASATRRSESSIKSILKTTGTASLHWIALKNFTGPWFWSASASGFLFGESYLSYFLNFCGQTSEFFLSSNSWVGFCFRSYAYLGVCSAISYIQTNTSMQAQVEAGCDSKDIVTLSRRSIDSIEKEAESIFKNTDNSSSITAFKQGLERLRHSPSAFDAKESVGDHTLSENITAPLKWAGSKIAMVALICFNKCNPFSTNFCKKLQFWKWCRRGSSAQQGGPQNAGASSRQGTSAEEPTDQTKQYWRQKYLDKRDERNAIIDKTTYPNGINDPKLPEEIKIKWHEANLVACKTGIFFAELAPEKLTKARQTLKSALESYRDFHATVSDKKRLKPLNELQIEIDKLERIMAQSTPSDGAGPSTA